MYVSGQLARTFLQDLPKNTHKILFSFFDDFLLKLAFLHSNSQGI